VRYVGKQILRLIIVVVVATFLSFTALRVSASDEEIAILYEGAGVTDDAVPGIMQARGLDGSIFEQYGRWAWNALRLDFGRSSQYELSNWDLLWQALPGTVWLMIWSLLISLAVAVPLGAIAAYRANTAVDRAASTSALVILSVPNYVAAVILLYVFALWLDFFPSISKYVSPFTDFGSHLHNVFLPAVALALGNIAIFMRLLRADMIATFQQDFVTMARAKGMSTAYVVWRHAFRPSMFSLVTAAATNVGALLGGSVIIELIFAFPGMGSRLLGAVFARDLFLVQAAVVVFSLVYVLVNLLVDLSYSLIDPRVRDMRSLS
jgi:peptide/nickel transport system permease protein